MRKVLVLAFFHSCKSPKPGRPRPSGAQLSCDADLQSDRASAENNSEKGVCVSAYCGFCALVCHEPKVRAEWNQMWEKTGEEKSGAADLLWLCDGYTQPDHVFNASK